MKIITRKILADSAPQRFKEQYEKYRGVKHYSQLDHGEVIDQLAKLCEPINPDEVDRIIGNKSWTSVPSCDECNADDLHAVVEIGQEPDYESSTARICHACITSATIRLAAEGVKS